jgi:hypothetical protein
MMMFAVIRQATNNDEITISLLDGEVVIFDDMSANSSAACEILAQHQAML